MSAEPAEYARKRCAKLHLPLSHVIALQSARLLQGRTMESIVEDALRRHFERVGLAEGPPSH